MLGVCTSLCISFYDVDGLTRYPVILLLMSWPTGIDSLVTFRCSLLKTGWPMVTMGLSGSLAGEK